MAAYTDSLVLGLIQSCKDFFDQEDFDMDIDEAEGMRQQEPCWNFEIFKDSLIRQTTGDKKNPFRYFTKHELKELFTLEDTRSSSTQLQLQSLHSSAFHSDPGLQHHISSLMDMNVFGVSRHDLLFSNEETEDSLQEEETCYINRRVQKAHELVQAESQLQSQMMDSIKQNTEPAWIYLSRQNGQDEPPHPKRSPSPVVDLTQSESGDLEIPGTDGDKELMDKSVIDLSEQVMEQSNGGRALMMSGEQSLVLPEISDSANHDSSIAMLGTETNSMAAPESGDLAKTPVEVQTNLSKAHSDSSEGLMEQGPDSSKSLLAVESFQGNFNLQLEDSAELLTEDKEQYPEELELSMGGGDFQLQMDVTGEIMEDCNRESRLSDGRQQLLVSTPTDDSISKPLRMKKKTQVIYDSEEEEEEAETPVLTSSPLTGIGNIASSTPKAVLTNSTINRRSLNTSVASRRSLVESLLWDMEEDDDGDDISGGSEHSQASEASEMCADESVVEEAEPSGETLNSENTGQSEEQSVINDSTELEMRSSETVDQCALSSLHRPMLPKAREETFESLVRSGRCSLAEGRKKEALDLFLKAIDINAGDVEVQLLVIQLYRQLSEHQP